MYKDVNLNAYFATYLFESAIAYYLIRFKKKKQYIFVQLINELLKVFIFYSFSLCCSY